MIIMHENMLYVMHRESIHNITKETFMSNFQNHSVVSDRPIAEFPQLSTVLMSQVVQSADMGEYRRSAVKNDCRDVTLGFADGVRGFVIPTDSRDPIMVTLTQNDNLYRYASNDTEVLGSHVGETHMMLGALTHLNYDVVKAIRVMRPHIKVLGRKVHILKICEDKKNGRYVKYVKTM